MSIIDDATDINTATYWPPGSEDSGGSDFDDEGQPLYGTPVEILCRWSDVVKEFLNTNGQRVMSRSIINAKIDLRTRGVLLQSALADVSDLADPKANDGAWEIRQVSKIPTLDGSEFWRKAFL